MGTNSDGDLVFGGRHYIAGIAGMVVMVKLTKNQLQREKVELAVKKAKQSTLDSIPKISLWNAKKTESNTERRISITEICNDTKQDELALKIVFSLFPSKASFSKIVLDLFFEGHMINSRTIAIPQSRLATDSFEFPCVLDMRGIDTGSYTVKAEMYERWSEEKLHFTSQEITIQYVPQTREARLVKIPTMKAFAGEDLLVVSDEAKSIYAEGEQTLKKETINKRDNW